MQPRREPRSKRGDRRVSALDPTGKDKKGGDARKRVPESGEFLNIVRRIRLRRAERRLSERADHGTRGEGHKAIAAQALHRRPETLSTSRFIFGATCGATAIR